MSPNATITTSADADAFMWKYLSRPSDVVARLVFADWLEETCVPYNAAWAHYIRAKAEAERYDLGCSERRLLELQAGRHAQGIRARLTISANLFVGYPKSLLQLLPARNITLRLGGFTPGLEVKRFVDSQIANLYRIFPVALQEDVLLVAHSDPEFIEVICEDLSNLFGVSILPVYADPADLSRALALHYPVFGAPRLGAAIR